MTIKCVYVAVGRNRNCIVLLQRGTSLLCLVISTLRTA